MVDINYPLFVNCSNQHLNPSPHQLPKLSEFIVKEEDPPLCSLLGINPCSILVGLHCLGPFDGSKQCCMQHLQLECLQQTG